MHYRRFPNKMVKVYTPPPPTSINPWLDRNNECPQLTTALGEFCLIILICFDLFGSWDWASRLSWERTPMGPEPLSVRRGVEIARRADRGEARERFYPASELSGEIILLLLLV